MRAERISIPRRTYCRCTACRCRRNAAMPKLRFRNLIGDWFAFRQPFTRKIKLHERNP